MSLVEEKKEEEKSKVTTVYPNLICVCMCVNFVRVVEMLQSLFWVPRARKLLIYYVQRSFLHIFIFN